MYTVSCVAWVTRRPLLSAQGDGDFGIRRLSLPVRSLHRSTVAAYLVVDGGVWRHTSCALAQLELSGTSHSSLFLFFSTRRFASAGASTQQELYIPLSLVSFSQVDANGLPDFFGNHGRNPASLMEGFVLAFPGHCCTQYVVEARGTARRIVRYKQWGQVARAGAAA